MHSRLLYLRAPLALLALLVLACALSACGGGDSGGGGSFSGNATATGAALGTSDNTAGKTEAASTTPNAGNGEPTVSYAP